MSPLDSANVNSLWCSVGVETWVRAGLRHAVISPGSRSTPLAIALARHAAVDAIPVVDERSAGFFALGLARATHRPVVVLCTSGSAGAHYLPAVIEAHASGVPLIIVTADRPPELRECASGQTIDQHRLFGIYVAWYHELAIPTLAEGSFAYLRQTLRQSWQRALAPGPVHLNAPFCDPLPPLTDGGETAAFASQLTDEFWGQAGLQVVSAPAITLTQSVTTGRGLIVAGQAMPEDPAQYARQVVDLARATGWPILADALSPVRQWAPADLTVVASYDLILRNESLARDLAPRLVVGLEGWPTSKVLRTWLERCQAEMVMISPRPGSQDAVHGRTREITAPVSALRMAGQPTARADYGQQWADAENQAQAALSDWMQAEPAASFEGRIAWRLAQELDSDDALVVASSMPVRDWEYFCPAGDRGLRVYASRGANGIDGTLSTALGVAHGGDRAVTLLTGDLAFLHDSNGLMAAHAIAGRLTVIVINNQGGGIFEHLPVARFEPEFERFFATPHQVDLAALCAAHRVAFARFPNSESLMTAWAEPGPKVRVLELTTDRKRDAATRQRLFRDVANALVG